MGPQLIFLLLRQLHLYGNERNFLVTYFNLGIVIGTVPAQLIQLSVIRPSYWIPACELLWSVLTMAMAGAKDVKTVSAPHQDIGVRQICLLTVRSSFMRYVSLLVFSRLAPFLAIPPCWEDGTVRTNLQSGLRYLSRQLLLPTCSAAIFRLDYTRV